MDQTEFQLGQIATVIDCEHKTAPIDLEGRYYSVRTSNLSNGKIDYSSCNRVSKETFDAWTARGIPQPNDIILAREAPVGEVGLVEQNHPTCLGQRTVLIHPVSEQVWPKYLLYYLASPLIKHELRVRSTGSVVAHLNMSDIRKFPIILPDLATQKKVARTLSLLDAKIDLLRRQNATLEALGAAVFREWFVEGEWETRSLGDLIENSRNGIKASDIKPTIPYVAMQHLEKQHLGIYETELGANADSNKSQFTKGDILFGKLRPYFHKIGLPNFNGVCSTDILVLRPVMTEILPFVLFCIHTSKFIDYCTQSSGGTRMPRVSYKTVSQYQIPLVKDDLMKEFSSGMLPYLNKIHRNIESIKELSSLRDLLLPKLMSGQVTVRGEE